MTCDLDDQPVCVDSGDMRDEKAGIRAACMRRCSIVTSIVSSALDSDSSAHNQYLACRGYHYVLSRINRP